LTEQHATPSLWLITDNKPGHRNQLEGLAARLHAHTGARLFWIDAAGHPLPVWRAILGRAPALPAELPAPDLIIAAGSGTHRLLLALRKTPGARTVVLMKPAFPLAWVDAAIIPAHDLIKPSHRVLVTEGTLNTVVPVARVTAQRQALVLVGGPSRHFDWDNNAIFSQLTSLIARYPQWAWTISDSRRTPPQLSARLAGLASANVRVVQHSQTHSRWLSLQLAAARVVWVTPDSASMVAEAVTSGVPTGVFSLPARAGSRVAGGITRLANRGLVGHWRDQAGIMGASEPAREPLWEADRAARWLLERFPAQLARPLDKEHRP